MLRALRQAAGLARQAPTATLAETGVCASLGGATALVQVTAAQAAPLAACRAAAAAAASQPWRRGLHAWAARLPAATCTAALPLLRGRCLNQQRAASAQVAEAASSAASSSSGLTISDGAVERLKELSAKSSGAVLLRVTVEGGGCSGFQYEFSIEEAGGQLAETDRLFERDGVQVVCDDISLEFLKGSTVDFESDLMRSAFVIATNPNAASSCGCGSSFVAK
jgi:iron-sulfur cluster assembly accessory protein